MKKINKFFLIFNFIILISLFLQTSPIANENTKYFSLKNNKVNLRQGPSFEYPIKLIYQKKFLPVKVMDKTDNWVKIIDYFNNSGWIHASQLSKRKSAICIKNNIILYKKNTIYSKPTAKLEMGRLVLVKKCKVKWCKITTGDFDGWVLKNSLWGKVK